MKNISRAVHCVQIQLTYGVCHCICQQLSTYVSANSSKPFNWVFSLHTRCWTFKLLATVDSIASAKVCLSPYVEFAPNTCECLEEILFVHNTITTKKFVGAQIKLPNKKVIAFTNRVASTSIQFGLERRDAAQRFQRSYANRQDFIQHLYSWRLLKCMDFPCNILMQYLSWPEFETWPGSQVYASEIHFPLSFNPKHLLWKETFSFTILMLLIFRCCRKFNCLKSRSVLILVLNKYIDS